MEPVLLTSNTVDRLCYNESCGFVLVYTVDGDTHLMKMPERVLKLIVHHFDFVCYGERNIEDAAGVSLPFKLYHKRPTQLAYAMSA